MFSKRTILKLRSFYRKLYSLVRHVEESPFVRLLSMLGLIAVLISLVWQSSEIKEARKERHEEGIARHWSRLLTIAPGNSGKQASLEYLARNNQSLYGIDISCSKITGKPTPCDTKTYLRGLDLSKDTIGKTVFLERSNFSGSSLSPSFFMGSELSDANLSYSNLGVANFQNATLIRTNFSFSNVSGADFTGAFLSETDFTSANLSGTKFYKNKTNSLKLIDSWAVAEDPPYGVKPQYLCVIPDDYHPKGTLHRPSRNTCTKQF